MKFKILALVLSLALSMSGWSQDKPAAAATPNSTPAPKAESCCHHNMADMKDGKGCCHEGTADAKGEMSCCGKDKNKCEAKDGKSCCAGKDMKAEMKECKKNDCCKGKNHCGNSKGNATAAKCCGDKCERHSAAVS